MAEQQSKPRRHGRIRKVSLEELAGIQPQLFRELNRRIAQTRLKRDRLPDDFLICEGKEWQGTVVFNGKRRDVNITALKPRSHSHSRADGTGVFVISNGAGVASNTVDQLATTVRVAGMIDLKRNFTEEKILTALRMARTARPRLSVIAVNMISGTALAPDTARAIERFHEEVQGRIPLVFRFNGPNREEHLPLLRTLERHPSITLAESTADLVEKTKALLASTRRAAAAAAPARLIESALATRSRLGVTLDPEAWLTPDRTLANVFGTKRESRIGVLGFGKTAQFQIRAMHREGVAIAWVVTPTADKYADSGVPGIQVFPSVGQAVRERGEVDIVLSYAPAAQVPRACLDCIQGSSGVALMVLVAENMPLEATIAALDSLEADQIDYLGPNSPGIMIVDDNHGVPDRYPIGNMPAHLFRRPGGLSVVGRSGTVIFDIVDCAATAGIGTRVAWAVGGDKFQGLGFLEALLMLEQDHFTRYIVLHGESGGLQEQLAAQLVATGVIKKPVLALVTGMSLPVSVQCGHAGAVKTTEADDPAVKEKHLQAAGVMVVKNPTEVAGVIHEINRCGWNLEERREQALWDQFVEKGRKTGYRWHDGLRPAYALLYDLVGHYGLYVACEQTPDHLHDLVTPLAALGVEPFKRLLGSTIQPHAFVTAFKKSREYTAALVRGIWEIGPETFTELIATVFSERAFNRALETTPWAAADLLSEAYEMGILATRNVIKKTMGLRLFRELLSEKPWNTAHAFRSINNMRWWHYVKAYHRYCTHLTGDTQLIKTSWARNPWASVKLVRGYDRIPDEGLEHALEEAPIRTLFFQMSRTDPQGLLDLGKEAFLASQRVHTPFPEVYRQRVQAGVRSQPSLEQEAAQMGEADLRMLIDTVFTEQAFAQSRTLHQDTTAQALRLINKESDQVASGAQKLRRVFLANRDALDTPAFHTAVGRNLWMTIDLLRAAGRLDPIDVRRLVDYVVTQSAFNYAVIEHQWGVSQALHKIADMSARTFFSTYGILEDVTRDKESFQHAFKKNPRDAVQIVQVIGQLGAQGFADLIGTAETRDAFLTRMRLNPRTTAHFLQEIQIMGVRAFGELADQDLGRGTLDALLKTKGGVMVRILRRINMVGIEDFRSECARWRAEDTSRCLTPDNALEMSGIIRERVLQRCFSNPDRMLPVSLAGQPPLEVSEGEIRGLYRAYPEWGDVLFKLQAGAPLTSAERVDLYHLVSGRKRFQTYVVPVLANFLPLREIRQMILRGESLIQELTAVRGITQHASHRFDVYFHTLETLNQLHDAVLPLDFLELPVRTQVNRILDEPMDGVKRRDLLVLAMVLHDLGKSSEADHHVLGSLTIARPILERFGLTNPQRDCVLTIIRYHSPKKLRKTGESWERFVDRGGLDRLYEEISDQGNNHYIPETILHYHADILGKRGSETAPEQVARRRAVTAFLLHRYLREHPENT